MTSTAQFNVEKELYVDYIDIKLSGSVSAKEIKAFYQNAYKVAQKNNISKVLINASSLDLDFDSLEVLQVMKSLQPMLSNLKIARVVSESCHQQMLIQQIADTKKLNIQTFADCQSATDWLFG